MTTSKHRYRPALTADEIRVLDSILKARYLLESGMEVVTTKLTTADYVILTQLQAKVTTLQAKVANNALQAAYVTKKHHIPEIATLESLGASEDMIAIATGGETKEAYWKRSYLKYSVSADICTVPEIEAAHEHMYLNDMMTPEQVARHEKKAK